MSVGALSGTRVVPEAPWATIPVRLSATGERRLEARTYLADGYGIRQRLEAEEGFTAPFSDVAAVWQPSRLKGLVVREGAGLPFLSAGQVFEAKPRVRKWLARRLLHDADLRYVEQGWLLLSCSGEVGKTTAVYPHHIGKIITHDLLRVVPRDDDDLGWLYAYMRTPSFYAIARSSQYGHMIKHLEPEHVLRMPVAMPEPAIRAEIGSIAARAVSLRIRALQTQEEADRIYAQLCNPGNHPIVRELYQSVPISEISTGRRRLEGEVQASEVRQIEKLVLESSTHGVDTVGSVSLSVALGNRFRRHFGPTGTPYRSASELFDVNAPVTKRIYAGLLDDPEQYLLRPGTIIMARSGQKYGLLGRSLVLTERHAGVFGSDDLIRIDPDTEKIRLGYLYTALNHETYGRPLVVRNASGTSIPHLDPVDVRTVPLPRFDPAKEAEVGTLAEDAIALSQEADRLEDLAIAEAEKVVEDRIGSLDVAGVQREG